jgi:hypothetical protein
MIVQAILPKQLPNVQQIAKKSVALRSNYLTQERTEFFLSFTFFILRVFFELYLVLRLSFDAVLIHFDSGLRHMYKFWMML